MPARRRRAVPRRYGEPGARHQAAAELREDSTLDCGCGGPSGGRRPRSGGGDRRVREVKNYPRARRSPGRKRVITYALEVYRHHLRTYYRGKCIRTNHDGDCYQHRRHRNHCDDGRSFGRAPVHVDRGHRRRKEHLRQHADLAAVRAHHGMLDRVLRNLHRGDGVHHRERAAGLRLSDEEVCGRHQHVDRDCGRVADHYATAVPDAYRVAHAERGDVGRPGRRLSRRAWTPASFPGSKRSKARA